MAANGDWAYVADRAEQLLGGLQTDSALHLAAVAAHNARRPELCLGLLDNHLHLFRQNKLPSELRWIRSSCHEAMGVLPKARAEAEELAREDPSATNLLTLARLHFMRGDLKSLSIVCRQVVATPDVAPEQLLWLAKFVQSEDRDLAISCWRRAVGLGLADNAVGQAIALGYQLGLDRELGTLTDRMTNLAQQGEGGIVMQRVEAMIPWAKKRRERMAKLGDFHRKGVAPIHVFAQQWNVALAALYHAIPLENENAPDPRRQFPLFARYGSRPLIKGLPDSPPAWRLNLDVTAVLMAAHLEVLPQVEDAFGPLRIPLYLMPSLLRMQDQLTHHQPSRLAMLREIHDLAARGLIRAETHSLPPDYCNVRLIDELGEERVARFEAARASNGHLVEFLPLKKTDLSGPPTALPDGSERYLINCSAIAEALRAGGPLSQQAHADALVALASEGRIAPSPTTPSQGSLLYCEQATLEVLAGASLLSLVCERFSVRVPQNDLDGIRVTLQAHDHARELGQWLDALMARIREGIDNGRYAIIPSDGPESREPEETALEDVDLACLVALLRFKPGPRDAVWADDRRLSAYPHTDGCPIITINDVLKGLVCSDALSVDEYYQKLHRLRAGNVLFIPVQRDEILYHLRQANVVHGAVVETEGLTVLRRYVAASLLQMEAIRKLSIPDDVPELPEAPPESAFSAALANAIGEALAGLWSTTDDDETANSARASWITGNLHRGHLCVFESTDPPPSDDDTRYAVAVSLAGLVAPGLGLEPDQTGGTPAPRARYMEWVFSNVLRKRFDADPRLLPAFGDVLKRTVIAIRDAMTEHVSLAKAIPRIQGFYNDLPEPIREELRKDAQFMGNIGLEFVASVGVDDLRFDPDEFWQAAMMAMNGQQAKVRPMGVDVGEVTFMPPEGGDANRGLCFDHPSSGTEVAVTDDALELLLESVEEREACLTARRHWFDCSDDEFGRTVAEIVCIESPRRRVDAATQWRDASATVHYAQLHHEFRTQGQLNFGRLLPPDVNGLLRHFRLTEEVMPDGTFLAAMATAAEALTHEEGLLASIDRCSCFPAPLPEPLMGAIEALSANERSELMRRVLKSAGSPVSLIHLLRILLHFADEAPDFGRLARRIVNRLLARDWRTEIEAFLAVLRWADGEFGRWRQMRRLVPQLRRLSAKFR